MSRVFSDYLTAVCRAVLSSDGQGLSRLLDVRDPEVQSAIKQAARSPSQYARSVDLALDRLADSPLVDTVNWHCSTLLALAEGNPQKACQHQAAIVGPFSKAYRDEESAWQKPVLITLAHNYRSVASAADAPNVASGRACTALEACGSQLQKYFSLAMGRTGDKGKRLAALEILITLFRVYFAINNLRLCKNLISAVDSRQFPPFQAFPASQRVTYNFFLGRIQIYDENYAAAMASLEYALGHCHPQAASNRRAILFYLIPLGMLHSRLPSPHLLAEVAFPSYTTITQALREGDLAGLEAEVERGQYAAIQAGTFLLLEKLRVLALRRLVKRCQLAHAAQDPGKQSQLPLSLLQAALRWQGQDTDIDEVECLVANLIARNLVKGYISHNMRTAVLSKVDAFPAAADHPPAGSL